MASYLRSHYVHSCRLRPFLLYNRRKILRGWRLILISSSGWERASRAIFSSALRIARLIPPSLSLSLSLSLSRLKAHFRLASYKPDGRAGAGGVRSHRMISPHPSLLTVVGDAATHGTPSGEVASRCNPRPWTTAYRTETLLAKISKSEMLRDIKK